MKIVFYPLKVKKNAPFIQSSLLNKTLDFIHKIEKVSSGDPH